MSSGALRAAWEAAQPKPDGPGSALRKAWEAGQSAGDPGMTDLLKEGGILPGADPSTRRHFDYRSGALQKRNEAATARDKATDEQAMRDATPGPVKALGAVASLARDIPGGEFLQTGARSIFRQQPLAEAFGDIRTAEDAAPALARNAARIAGGTTAALAMGRLPNAGSVAQQGMKFGALSAATSADPTKGIRERVNDAVMQGALGAIAGKATEGASNLIRVGRAKTTGAVQEAREAARSKAVDPLYDEVRAQAAAGGGTSPGVKTALDHPLVKPLADDIRGSLKLQGRPADDATVLMQAGRELSQNERALIDRAANAPSSRPLTAREQGDVKAVKQMLRDAASNTSEKPPLHLDIPGKTTEVAPRVTPGHEPKVGPIPGEGTTTVPFKHAGARDERGLLRRDLSGVPDDALEAEHRRLAEMNANEEGLHGSVQDSHYRNDYNELPRTEKYGRKGQEDLPDADGMVDAERLVADNKIVGGFNRSGMARRARQQAMDRIEAEIQRRPPRPVDEGEDVAFDFGSNVKRLGPEGPAFQLRGNPGKVTPGVRIETPAMRVQTAPAEQVPGLMPSLPKADATYAEHSGELKAFQATADATNRIAKGTRVAGKNLGKKSPERVQQELRALVGGKAKAATEGVLGEAKNNVGLSPNPLTGFGVGKSAVRVNRLAPYLRTLDETTGGDPVANLLRALGISTAGANR